MQITLNFKCTRCNTILKRKVIKKTNKKFDLQLISAAFYSRFF